MNRFDLFKCALGVAASLPMISVATALARSPSFESSALEAGTTFEPFEGATFTTLQQLDDIAVISGSIDAPGAVNLVQAGFMRYVHVYEGGATSLIRPLSDVIRGVVSGHP